jgi:hypothetical protein
MTEYDKEQFIQHVKTGSGRGFAASQLKLTMRNVNAALKSDPAFKDRVATEEIALGDLMLGIISNDALQNGSVSSAAAWLSHQHRVQAQADHMKLERQKLVVRKREVEAKVKAVDSITATSSPKLSLRALTMEELDAYSQLTESVFAGETLQPDEYAALGQITAKLMIPDQSSKTAALNGLTNGDNMFESEDDDDWEA